MQFFRTTLLAVLAACSLSATAESIYGIELGAQLKLPECRKYQLLGDVRYEVTTSAPCLHISAAGAPSAILFPFEDKPSHLKGNLAGVIAPGGVLQVLVLTTEGLKNQQTILEDLVAKFGPPGAQQEQSLQTGIGAQFKVIRAAWDRGDGMQIEFSGANDRIDEGLLIFGTKVGIQERTRRIGEMQRKFGGRPL